MPDDFEGGRSALPFMLGAGVMGGYGYRTGMFGRFSEAVGRSMATDPISAVVAGRRGSYYAGMEGFAPDIAAIDPKVSELILEGFRRRVGQTAGFAGMGTLQEAVTATQGFPAIQSILKQSIQEFAGIKPGQIGAPIAAGGMIKDIPLKLTGPRAISNEGAVSAALSRNELGLSSAQRTALRGHLEELAAISREMMDKVPTFQLQTVNDKAISEMIVSIHRAGGPVEMRVPLPTPEGAITTAHGVRYHARKVLTGGAQESYAGEYAIQRLTQLVREQQGGITQRQVGALESEIGKQLIHTGDVRGILPGEGAGATYGRQLLVPRIKGQEAAYLSAMERLSGEGRAVGMTADALSKGIVWTKEGAARLPSKLTPQHFGQAATKGQFLFGAGQVNLFQVSPQALERAGKQLGLGAMTPQQDTIMMAKTMKDQMRVPMNRPMTLDPTMAASHRFEKIQQLLKDNTTARRMLEGGASVEETMAAYMAKATQAQYQEMAVLRRIREGEFLGFTKSGPQFAKTYGADTMIRDIRTVDGMTKVTLSGQYTAQKVFSAGGIKHQLEFADPEAIQRLGVRAKALELMQMRGIDPNAAGGVAALRGAEAEAQALYEGSVGIAVEGTQTRGGMYRPWEKTGGAAKNVARFNQLIEEKWMGMGQEMPAGWYETENLMKRRQLLLRQTQKMGFSYRELFHPAVLAQRAEFLQPGPAAEMLGIGRQGTFTDDAFRIFKSFGWTSIAEDTLSRVQRDAPLGDLLERAMIATRGEGAAVALEDIVKRPGGLESILEDAAVRAKFIEQEGGVIGLPQKYRIAGKDITQISIPHMGTGYTGYFTTPEGREIMRDLDRSLKDVLRTSAVDIGVEGVAPGEFAGAAALKEYYQSLANLGVKQRNILGGTVAGSRQFAIGRQLLPEEAMATIGEGVEAAIPTARFHPETFENWVAENLQEGMINRSMAREQRRLFYEGRLPMKAIKHPARGPLSTNLFFAGVTPTGAAGWEAERNVMYLGKSLLKPFMADLDWDPLHVDMMTSRNAMTEATAALESGQVSKLIETHKNIREKVLGRTEKGAGTGITGIMEGDRISTKFMKETSARAAAGKTKVGAFTTRVTWPVAAAAEEAGMGLDEWFRSSFWAEIMEESTTMKARHDLTMAAGAADEIAHAFQTGNTEVLKQKTRSILMLQKGQEAHFDDVLDKLSATWQNMSADKRAAYEARFAGKGRASAKTFFKLAAEDATTAAMSKKGTTGVAANVSKVFGGLGNAMRGHKKQLILGLAASTAAAMLFVRPKDLTPEAVESGKVAGGPEQTPARLPMPRLEKGLYYKEGSRPGYKINLNLSKEIDHKALARQLSHIVGQKPVNVYMNDARRRISRHDIEREMRKDRGFGSSSGFYNSSRYG